MDIRDYNLSLCISRPSHCLNIEPDISLQASLVAQMIKNLPAIQETWVQSLGWEDLLEKGMATHSSILAWRIPWTEEPGELVHGVPESQDWPTFIHSLFTWSNFLL